MHPKITTRTGIILWAVACILIGAGHSWLRRLPSQAESYPAAVTGSFVARPFESIGRTGPSTYWVSDFRGGPGSVSLGPFPAPDHVEFEVRADSGVVAAEVHLELGILKFRLPVAIPLTGHWEVVDQDIPLGWRGRPITLNASAPGGLAVSEPFGPGSGGDRRYGLMETLTAWLANGLLYGAVFVTLARFLARRDFVKACWVPLAACAFLALIGYAAFWAYFASPTLGKLFSCALFLATFGINVGGAGRFDGRDQDWLRAAGAAVVIGLLYLGIFHLFPVHRDYYDLASDRFVAGLPGDDRLPFDFADMVYHGQRPVELGAGWLSSDRPPLQEGWQLLAWPATGALGFSDQSASATASVWLQLSWVLALYGLLRSLGMAGPRAISWVLALSLSGFFLLHTLFTWPKLCSGAFACGAFGMWVLGGGAPRLGALLLGGLFAGLACLAHGGAAFVFIPLVPWVAWRSLRGEFVPWVLAALVFAVTVAPWAAYQRYVAPPGNRLLKWHLAGDFDVDDKPVLRAMSEAYGSLTWGQILGKRASNLGFQFGGNWADAASFSGGSAEIRRSDEFFHAFRALGWWIMAVPLLAASLFLNAPERRPSEFRRAPVAVAAWVVSTMVIWCMLMFTQTEVAQGPFAMMIALFALCALWVDLAGRWWLPCLALLQACSFACTWIPGSASVNGPVSAGAVAIIALAVAAGAAMIRGIRGEGTIGERVVGRASAPPHGPGASPP